MKEIPASVPPYCFPTLLYNPPCVPLSPPPQKYHIVVILFAFYVMTFELLGLLYPTPNARDDDRYGGRGGGRGAGIRVQI